MTIASGQPLQHGRYQIRRRLGQGGMATVYLAEDRNLPGRLVAIKENTDTNREAQEQFKREAIILAQLNHPNLPRVTDYFVELWASQYLVMDYVPGETLREILARNGGPLPEEEVLGWIEQVMAALAYMHTWVDSNTGQTKSVIHRDIKPQNIKQTSHGRVVLVDFGLAKVQTETPTMVGARGRTVGYSPPEQSRGGTDVRSDIYGLGATLYKLLTGETPTDVLERALGSALPLPRRLNPHISPNTESVILRALAMEPEKRFQSIAEMQAALFATIKSASTATLSPAAMQPQPPDVVVKQFQYWIFGSRYLLLLLATLSVVLFVVFGQESKQSWLRAFTQLVRNGATRPAEQVSPTRTVPSALIMIPTATQTPLATLSPQSTSANQIVFADPLITATARISTPTAGQVAQLILTATPKQNPTPTLTAQPTPILSATIAPRLPATSTPQPTMTATSVSPPTPQPTSTPQPTPPQPLQPTATRTTSHTAIATSTPRPTAMPSPATALPQITETPLLIDSITLLEPLESILGGRRTFRWQSNAKLLANQGYELVFWPVEQDPMTAGFGPVGTAPVTEQIVDLDKTADILPNLLIAGRDYAWGVLVVELNPYRRLYHPAGEHHFRFDRNAGSGSAESGSGESGSGSGGGGSTPILVPTNTPRG